MKAAPNKKYLFWIISFLFLADALALSAAYDLSRASLLEVNFFNVGQGDSIFIETPQGHQILIDGGPGSSVLQKLAEAMPFWDRTIDLVILTHPESDHLAGLIEVLKKYKVGKILSTGVIRDTPEFEEWKKLINKEGVEIKAAAKGNKIEAGSVLIEILYPGESLADQVLKDSNDSSLVARLVFGEKSFLFTGDIMKSAEEKLLADKVNIDSDVLKVAHHGSKTSSQENFIDSVSPEVSVISLEGKNEVEGGDCDNKERNRYGHPSCQVLEVLGRYGKILRTDEQGDIKIISDGQNLAY